MHFLLKHNIKTSLYAINMRAHEICILTRELGNVIFEFNYVKTNLAHCFIV
jgi:hypothetical protein